VPAEARSGRARPAERGQGSSAPTPPPAQAPRNPRARAHPPPAPPWQEADLCDALAAAGFAAAAPDLFGGRSTSFIPRALALGYPAALAPGADYGVPAVADAVAWLKAQPGIDPARVAVAGFCLGGGAALRFAAGAPGAAAAVGVFYGRPLDAGAPDGGTGGGSSGGGYAALKGVPVFGVYGGRDAQFSAAMVDGLEVGAGHTRAQGLDGAAQGLDVRGGAGPSTRRSARRHQQRETPLSPPPPGAPPLRQAGLAAAGALPEVRRYPEQGHAFITDAAEARRPGSDAADAWGGFVDFLRRALR
jgi:dienelactone hydrolase